MSLIRDIRKKSRLSAITIAIIILLFILGGQGIMVIMKLFSSQESNVIAAIGNKEITYNEYYSKVQNIKNNISTYYGHKVSDKEEYFIKENLWNSLISQYLYPLEYKKLGLVVSDDELFNIVQGDNIHPYIKQLFKNDGVQDAFDKKNVVSYLKNLKDKNIKEQERWEKIEEQLISTRLNEKLTKLIQKSIFINSLEKEFHQTNKNKELTVNCVYLPYSSIPNSEVKIENSQIKEYIEKNNYQILDESRDIEYTYIHITPSETDKLEIRQELENILNEFKNTEESDNYAKMHTDDEKVNNTTIKYNLSSLPKDLIPYKENIFKGSVIGPLEGIENFKLYKVTNINANECELAVIERKVLPSNKTKEQILKQANTIRGDFNKNIKLYTEKNILKSRNYTIGAIEKDVRKLVNWVYKSKLNNISPVLELGDKYVIAKLKTIRRQGKARVEDVREEVSLKIMQKLKFDIIKDKVKSQNDNPNLKSLLPLLGKDAKLLENIKITNSVYITSIGKAPNTVGRALAMNIGEVTEPIAEENGIIIMELVNHNDINGNNKDYFENLTKIEELKQTYDIPHCLSKILKVRDYRYKFE